MTRVLRYCAWGALVWPVVTLGELSLRISLLSSFGPGEVISSYDVFGLFGVTILLSCMPGALAGALFALIERREGEHSFASLIAFEASFILLLYGGLWVHAILLAGIGPLAPVSVLSSVLLLAAALTVFLLIRKVPLAPRACGLFFAVLGLLFACTSLLPFFLAKQATGSLLGRNRETGRDILLVTLDTTRRDAVGSYGNSVFATPVLDSLAGSGVRFTHAVSQSPFTGPSHASLLTSLYPASHGVRTNGMRIREGTLTMASLLAREGYATVAVLGGASLSHDACGLDEGFIVYDDVFTPFEAFLRTSLGEFTTRLLRATFPCQFAALYHSLQQRKASAITDTALGWLRKAEGKTFLWAHYFDPHFTYAPPEPFRTEYAPGFPGEFRPYRYLADLSAIFGNTIGITEEERLHAWSLYGGEVSYVDSELGRLLAGLESMGRLEGMLVVVVADHGEYFGEHGYYFMHDDLYDEVLGVPFILAGLESERESLTGGGVVEMVDIMPTILQIVMLPRPEGLEGSSLCDEQARTGYAFSDCGPCGKVSVRDEDSAVILDLESGEKERLVRGGAGESMTPEESAALEAALEGWLSGIGMVGESGPGAEESERLKSLGYIW